MDFGESVLRDPEVVAFKLILKGQKDLIRGLGSKSRQGG